MTTEEDIIPAPEEEPEEEPERVTRIRSWGVFHSEKGQRRAEQLSLRKLEFETKIAEEDARTHAAIAVKTEREVNGEYGTFFNKMWIGIAGFTLMYITYTGFVCATAGSYIWSWVAMGMEQSDKAKSWLAVLSTKFSCLGFLFLLFTYFSMTAPFYLAPLWSLDCFWSHFGSRESEMTCEAWQWIWVVGVPLLIILGFGIVVWLFYVFLARRPAVSPTNCPKRQQQECEENFAYFHHVWGLILVGCVLYWVSVFFTWRAESIELRLNLSRLNDMERLALNACRGNRAMVSMTRADVHNRSDMFEECSGNWKEYGLGGDLLKDLVSATETYNRNLAEQNPFVVSPTKAYYNLISDTQQNLEKNLEKNRVDMHTMGLFLVIWSISGAIIHKKVRPTDGWSVSVSLGLMFFLSAGAPPIMEKYCPTVKTVLFDWPCFAFFRS